MTERTDNPAEAGPRPPFDQPPQEPPGTEAEMRPAADHGQDSYRGFDRLAQELTPKGIRVNAVAPGPVWRPLIPMSMPPEATREFGANSPMQRPAQPAELALPYVFLACDESRYVSGEILAVTGGMVTG